eukprot:464845_1
MFTLLYPMVLILTLYNILDGKVIKSIGKWQHWGGNLENQQIARFADNKFNKNELLSSLSSNSSWTRCNYKLGDTSYMNGFIAIDNKNRAIFATSSGLIRSIDLDLCKLVWSISISEILGYDPSQNLIYSRDTVSLYKSFNNNATTNDDDDYSILFGTSFSLHSSTDIYDGCYIVSISSLNGDLEWSLNLGTGYANTFCQVHGFIIDGHFAFGGMSSYANTIPYKYQGFRGKFMKINLLTHTIDNIWYSFPENKSGKANESSYTGASIWGWPAIIDDYIIFGTGQMFSVPDYINECFKNDSNINFNKFSNNICGDNVENETLYWKCMEYGNIYPSSLIVLNKHSFELQI